MYKKTDIMKPLRYLLIAGCFILLSACANAQSVNDDEPITAETFIEMASGESTVFAMSALQAQNTANGFALIWQTLNEKNVASFQLEAGEDKKQLKIIKTIPSSLGKQQANRYQLDFNLSNIQAEKAFFRIKANFTNGKSVYGDVMMVKMKKK